jgi:hypothetical protein
LPLVGVLGFGWGLYAVLVVYWIESGVVGALNVRKVLLAAGTGAPTDVPATVDGRRVYLTGPDEPRDGPHLYVENVPAAGFFVLHYRVFWAVHGGFVLGFSGFVSGANVGGVTPVTVLVGTFGMVASDVGSFFVNFLGRAEYRATSPDAQMTEPCRSVVVLHVTIVLGVPLTALLLLIWLKTAGDLYAHLDEHGRAAERRRTVRDGGGGTRRLG